jgi:hypothetical protein
MFSEMTGTATGFCFGGNGVGAGMLAVMLEMCSQIFLRSFVTESKLIVTSKFS